MTGEEPVPYGEFERLAGAFAIAPALRTISELSTERLRMGLGDDQSGLPNHVQQFALAGIAKAVINNGRTTGSAPVDRRVIEHLCGAFISLEDPILTDAADGGALDRFIVRVAYEQFPWQESLYASLSRTKLLFAHASNAADQGVINDRSLASMLGCTLDEFLAVAFLLQVGASQNEGTFDLRWLTQPNFEEITRVLPAQSIRDAVAKHFVQGVDEFRQRSSDARIDDDLLRRYEFNPLLVKPFIDVGQGPPMAPIPPSVFSRASSTGLYFIGLDALGKPFLDAMGPVFEKYVELHLESTGPEVLLCDVEYEPGKKAADFVVVFPEAVLIIEVKATPLRHSSKLAMSTLDDDLRRAPVKAVKQIVGTDALIRDGHPAFAAVPTDRPRVGLVVTLEPYYQVDARELQQARLDAPLPVALASCAEFENLVAAERGRPDRALLRVPDLDRVRSGTLRVALESHHGENVLLTKAWNSLPFMSIDR